MNNILMKVALNKKNCYSILLEVVLSINEPDLVQSGFE